MGLAVSLLTEVENAVAELEYDETPVSCGIITGVLPAEIMEQVINVLRQKRPFVDCKIYPVVNHFFGEQITVAGLVTATDIINQLKGKPLPERLLIPSSMLRSEQDMFLDSITTKEVEKKLERKITVVFNDGYDLINKILGRKDDENV